MMKHKFWMSKLIYNWYRFDEMYVVIVYGDRGKGKSAYTFKVGVDILTEGNWGKRAEGDDSWAWEMIKSRVVFTPKQFLNKLDEIESRVEFIIWDDAGLWLNALRWHDPFVQSVQEYLNVARTDMACMLMTTPTAKMILKKIREGEDTIYTVHVRSSHKSGRGSRKQLKDGTWVDYKYREARIYRTFLWPDGNMSLPEFYRRDEFSAMMPDEFYKWYKPYRDKYAETAKILMKLNLAKKEEDARKQGKIIPSLVADETIDEIYGKVSDELKLHEFIEEAGVDA